MSETHHTVIIGAGFAGLITLHHIIKNILPKLKSTARTYTFTLLSPSPKFFHRVSAPRALINPQLHPLSTSLVDIAPGLAPYRDQVRLVLGYAAGIDHAAKTVIYEPTGEKSESDERELTYDSLIITSGADATDGAEYWGVTPGEEKVKAAFEDVHARLEGARRILVAGGGPVGAETAGELAERFGREEGREILLYSGSSRLLAGIDNVRFGRDAERKLVAKGVEVVHGVKVEGSRKNADGSTTVMLEGGGEKTVDLYVPAMGLRPNSGFVPKEWKDERTGRVRCDGKFRVDVQGVKGVYAFGNVASYSDGTLFDVKFAYKVLGETFRVDQVNETGGSATQYWGYWRIQNRNVQLTPIGRYDGVIVIMGWRLFSWICVFIKSRNFMVGQIPEYTHGKGV